LNRGGCNNCNNSPWVLRANAYIQNPTNPRALVETIRFLLENGHCGIDNRTRIQNITDHLETLGYNYNREAFQNTILTELKREGIIASLIYSGPQGGIFIPCDQSDIRRVVQQGFDRIIQVLRNMEGSATGTHYVNILSDLREIVTERLKQINGEYLTNVFDM